MKIIIDGEEYITQDEVEKMIGAKRTTLATYVKYGTIPSPIKLSFRRLWKKHEIEEYLQETLKAGI